MDDDHPVDPPEQPADDCPGTDGPADEVVDEPAHEAVDAAGADDATDGDDAADEVAPRVLPSRRRRVLNQLLTGLLTLLLGFGATVQVRLSREPGALPGATQEDLLSIFDTQKAEADRLAQQVGDARAAVQALDTESGDSGEALANADQRAEALALLTGAVAATGPGIRMSISDPDGGVPASVLLDAVQELRGAGAEAIQLDGVRVVVSSSFTDSASGVVVDGQLVQRPYDLLAIGPADDLRAALTGPGLPVSDVTRDGGDASVAVLADVRITAVVRR